MGAMKRLLEDFCALVYPDDPDQQYQLARDLIVRPSIEPAVTTVEDFRRVYEDTGCHPKMDLEQMSQLVKDATP
jgi:hypothetical protein